MLEINVSQILKGTIGTQKSVQVSGDVDVTGFGVAHAEGSIKLTRTNRSILVKGRLETSVKVECARCLETYDCPLVLNIEEEYFPAADVNTGAPLPEPDEEAGAFVIDEQLILDLSEAVRQYTLMAVPMKPLCRTECPGIII